MHRCFHLVVCSLLGLWAVACESPAISQQPRSSTAAGNTQEITRSEGPKKTTSATCEHLFKEKKLCGVLTWESTAKINEYAQAKLTFSDLKVFLWMPAHGHGSSPVEVFKKDGFFSIEDILFTMPGAWEVHVQVLDETTQKVVDDVSWPVVL